MKLHMSESDIVIDFKNAKDKKEMIQILLDQNPMLTKEELLELLEKHGCKVGWFKAAKANNFHRFTKEKFNDVTEDYEEVKAEQEEVYEDLPFTLPKAPEMPEFIKTSVTEKMEKLKSSIDEAKKIADDYQRELNQLESWAEYNGISFE